MAVLPSGEAMALATTFHAFDLQQASGVTETGGQVENRRDALSSHRIRADCPPLSVTPTSI